jgi:predicted nucleotidyltransferase
MENCQELSILETCYLKVNQNVEMIKSQVVEKGLSQSKVEKVMRLLESVCDENEVLYNDLKNSKGASNEFLNAQFDFRKMTRKREICMDKISDLLLAVVPIGFKKVPNVCLYTRILTTLGKGQHLWLEPKDAVTVHWIVA